LSKKIRLRKFTFPAGPFAGHSVRAVLLRNSFPVALAVILVFVCVPGVLSSFLSPLLTLFLTLAISLPPVIFLLLKSSLVVGVQLEKALQESEQNYTHLVQGLNDHAVFLLDSSGGILVWNPGAELITGYTAADVVGKQVSQLFKGREPGLDLDQALQQVRSEGGFKLEGWAGRKNGQPFWAEISLSRLVNENEDMIGVSVIIRDATERRKAEDSMKASIQEKEVLLKEIHHRVKNNLQVISSLLRLQSETVKDKETAALFLDSQERVQSMAMVHEYLYKSTDLARINLPAYVAGLVRNLSRTFGLTSSETPPHVEVDNVNLSLDVAVPCGLLLTELISNAAKYAYPGKNGGPVDVRFRNLSNGVFELSVADKGVGFPKNFDWTKADSLGLRLVRLLTDQLQGDIVMENHQGIKFIVTFKDKAAGS
jgi:PAS domain S-box-containing protein